MNFPDFKKVSDGLTAGLNQIILDNNSASGIFQMYMNHYKSFEYKHMKK